MKRIAVFTPKIFYPQIEYALTELGFKVFDYSYGIIDNTSTVKRILTAKNPSYAYTNQSITFNALLERLLQDEINKCDIILFFKGQKIKESLLPELKSISIPKIYWSIDSLNRLPGFNCHTISDYNFYQDGGDCVNENDYWLPLGISSENFYPTGNKKYDITFVGRTKGKKYIKRAYYLKYLINSDLSRSYNINIITNLNSVQRVYLKTLKRKFNFLDTQPFNTFARYIRESKVVINIHQDDGYMPINPLFFSIPFSKTIQVVDKRDYFKEWLPENLFIASDPRELEQKLRYCMENYKIIYDRFAWVDKTLICHTMKERFAFILKKIT